MSVDAIQQVIQAEEQAEKILQETNLLIEEKQKNSQAILDAFRAELSLQEKKQQQELLAKQTSELEQLKGPLIKRTTGEVEKLQQVSPELRGKAIALILEAVVN